MGVTRARELRGSVQREIGALGGPERLPVIVAQDVVDQHVLAVLLVEESRRAAVLLDVTERFPLVQLLVPANVFLRLREGHALSLKVLPRLALLPGAKLNLAEGAQL